MESINRKELLIGFLLALLLIVVMGAGWFFWQQSRPASVASGVTGTATAQTAYATAQERALVWAVDAQLLSAQNTWTMDENGRFSKFDWGFIFYSPAENRSVLITVGSTGISIGDSRVVTTQPQPASDTLWQIDSPDLADEILKMAKAEQMESREAATLTFLLNMDNMPVWTTTLFNRETGYFLRVTTDADSGAIVNIEQSTITMPSIP